MAHTLTHIPQPHTTYTRTHPCTHPLCACTHVYIYPCFRAHIHTPTHISARAHTRAPMHTFISEQVSQVLQVVVLASASLTWGHPLLSFPLREGLSGCSLRSPVLLPVQPYLTPSWWPQGNDFILQSLFFLTL